MQQKLVLEPIRYSLGSDDPELFSRHFIEDVFASSKLFEDFDATGYITQFQDLYNSFPSGYLSSVKEDVIEKEFLLETFKILGTQWRSQPTIKTEEIDYAFYIGTEFDKSFANTTALCEVKRQGILNKHYYIKSQDNKDPTYQLLSYLKEVNVKLANTEKNKKIPFGLLTDGALWRIYSAQYTHDPRQFENHFIEFNINDIFAEHDLEKRDKYLKLFIYFMHTDAWQFKLARLQSESIDYGTAVTTELKTQLYSSLELIATGFWRKLSDNYNDYTTHVFATKYAINITKIEVDEDERNKALKVVYDESLVLLLRLLFVLYAEDRNSIDRKLIKTSNGILERIRALNYDIGAIPERMHQIDSNDDVHFAEFCKWIDQTYNGGLFSAKEHPLLTEFNIEDTLFANAVDLLCRVKVGKDIVTVDFSALGVRELGTIYEGLLEYKLEIATEYIAQLPALMDTRKKRLDIEVGDVYLINHDGARKSSGSYYTPDDMVLYLTTKTLGIKIEKIISTAANPSDAVKQILALKVIDPAMGSGHFLLAAFDILVQAIALVNEEHELGYSYQDIKAQVARKCLYGVDYNGIAVEIAKMVLWLKVFQSNKPFEFFDYNLQQGNSLVGIYDELQNQQEISQLGFFDSIEKIEASNVAQLTKSVETLLGMPRETIEDVHVVERYYNDVVKLWQKTITFFYNLKLVEHLDPDNWQQVKNVREDVLKQIQADPTFIIKLYSKTSTVKTEYKILGKIAQHIEEEFSPFHWKVEFPHVFVSGGFDVVLGNPPWDIIKPNHNSFFSDYIQGYSRLETKVAKAASQQLVSQNNHIKQLYDAYLSAIEKQNSFFANAYKWQVVADSDGKKLRGDNNLYKVFIEKAHTILKQDGMCGFVVPSGLNTDQGCTGLRRLLFDNASVQEIIMFENKRAIFPDVHRQYKFETIIFSKNPARKKDFTVGFYWQDARWLLAPIITGDNVLDKQEQTAHERFVYPTRLSQLLSPEMGALLELRNKKDIAVVEQIAKWPLLGDDKQTWYGRPYREFDMTLDSKLFNTDGEGYPLFEGKTMHQFDAHFESPTRYVISGQGEERLARKWGTEPHRLPNRQYRIGFRSIASATNERTLIAALLPKYIFSGNSVNFISTSLSDVQNAGLVAILNSFVLDYIIRSRVSTNVNAFYVKELPVPRDTKQLEELGKLSLPLLYGQDFDEVRGAVASIDSDDIQKRHAVRAAIDAKIAHIYCISYEQLQHIMTRFPLVDAGYKQLVLHVFKSTV